jgi:hypothetical protein
MRTAMAHEEIEFITSNEKFGILAMDVHANLPSSPHKIGNNLWISGSPLVDFDEHWREWLGSIRHDHLRECSLIAVIKILSKTPTILDAESKYLLQRANWFYAALSLITRFHTVEEPLILSGGNENGIVDIREVAHIERSAQIPGLSAKQITLHQAQLAGSLLTNMEDMSNTEGFTRLSRILFTFLKARELIEPLDRLHQFSRCIEGLIVPEHGKSKARFQSRTRTFIGNKHEDFMGRMYDIRGAVEHLNDHIFVLSAGRKERISIIKMAVFAEYVTRECLLRIHTNRKLWPHFQSDDSFKSFWALNETDRGKIWGPTIDTTIINAEFNEARIRDSEIGLM